MVVFEYVVTEYRTYLFVVTTIQKNQDTHETTLYTFPIKITRVQLSDIVSELKLRVSNPQGSVHSLSRQVYDLLLKPAEALLAGKKMLIFIPDDCLWELPFQTLKNQQQNYLLKLYAISYVQSLTVLHEMEKARRSRSAALSKSVGSKRNLSLLFVGNPTLQKQDKNKSHGYHSEQLGELNSMNNLADQLRSIYGVNKTTTLIGKQATEPLVRHALPKHRIIQFATHGILDDEHPMYSHLVLSQTSAKATYQPALRDNKLPNEGDGLLDAFELIDVELNAELVILSACETARGHTSQGQGVIGLAWSLFLAGCPTTIVSQWEVEEKSTSNLMLAFHQNLLRLSKGPSTLDKSATALQQAAVNMMGPTQSRHPYYWAGFVVTGTAR